MARKTAPKTKPTEDMMERTFIRAVSTLLKTCHGDALREAATIARNGCLVPPDGGSPSHEEAEMCDRIADAILRLI